MATTEATPTSAIAGDAGGTPGRAPRRSPDVARATPSRGDGLSAMIGELLQARGLLSVEDLARGLAIQKEIGGRLGQVLHRIGAVTEERLMEVLSEQLAIPVLRYADAPAEAPPYLSAASRLGLAPAWFVARRAAAWIEPNGAEAAGERLRVLAADPLSPALRETLDAAAHNARIASPVAYALGDNQTVDLCVAKYELGVRADDDDASDASRLRELAEEAPVIDFVNALFTGAMRDGASDIHIEAYQLEAFVRYRIDGVLHERERFARTRFDAVASRIKLIAGMDIAERRLPQDGRCTVRFAGKEVDLRVSCVPSTWGESLVIRLLRKQTELPDLAGLGLTGRVRDVLERMLAMPNGVFLVTGPTGSGKSTTLYRGLEQINDGARKIITIEDPVEYDVAGVTQIQVRAEIGYTFANGLRAILRQDPDVIMIGEIRDAETAQIAVQAALTGHFVFSTLHTNSALTAITRLRDIGLQSYLIAASVRGLMAQRLVRRLCPHCSEPAPTDDPSRNTVESRAAGPGRDLLDSVAPAWRRAVGCVRCAGTGYKGRIAIAEVAEVDDALRDAVAADAPAGALFEIARRNGFITLFEDGVAKAKAGDTTVDEVLRVCSGDFV